MNRLHNYTKEEILTATNIGLDKNWDVFLTPFIEYNKVIHTDECAHTISNYDSDVDCTCEPKIIPSIMAKILAMLKEEEKYFQCNISEEKAEVPEDCWKLPYEAISTIPLIHEDLINGLDSTAQMLKAYEVSGNTDFDFFELRMLDGKILEGKELAKLLYS